jgi:hypothetical protein
LRVFEFLAVGGNEVDVNVSVANLISLHNFGRVDKVIESVGSYARNLD